MICLFFFLINFITLLLKLVVIMGSSSSSSSNSTKLQAMTMIIFSSVFSNCIAGDIKIKCTNIDEFYFAKPGSHCTSYYKCTKRGEKEVRECGPGSMFDFYTQTCTRNSGICYEPICTGRTNGVYQDTTHACRRSFTCHSGKVISIDNCPLHHLHNGQRCVNQDLVMCDLPHTTAIGYPFSGDQRCAGKPDGSHSIDDCSNYAICKNQEVADIRSCPDGYKFKDEIHQCVLANELPYCSNSIGGNVQHACRHKRNGDHSDPTSMDCKAFLICQDGKLIGRELCASDSIFNGEYCVPSQIFTCPTAMWSTENDICNGQENGFFPNPTSGCSSYVRCMFGRAVEFYDCPNGQYFDPDEKYCVFEKFSDKQKCSSYSINSVDCENKAQGFYQGPDCVTYYFCINGYKTEYKCPGDKIFNGYICVPRELYECPLDGTCLTKPDGYYTDREKGCRSYYYCSSGHKITYLCEVGHIFDGIKCIPSSQAPQCPYNSICLDKSDGYHADLESHCRNYVFCKNYEKITELTCRGNKIFDGERCVSSSTYTCPSQNNHKELNCMPKKCTRDCVTDGFFPDIESNCRNYFFCIGGKRSSLSCTAGQVFNGEICVPQDRFTCPIYCDETHSSSSSYECPLSGFR